MSAAEQQDGGGAAGGTSDGGAAAEISWDIDFGDLQAPAGGPGRSALRESTR